MSPSRIQLLAALLITSCTICACVNHENAQSYQGKGQVVAVAGDATNITIAHDDIEGFMPAMTMRFPVKVPGLLDGISTSDLVEFDLEVTPSESWVSGIRRTGRGAEIVTERPSTATLSPGEKLAPFNLVNQAGAPVRLAGLAGTPFALTFIYTRCPIPEYCPRFTDNFSKVQRALTIQYPGGFRLLSVSIDPEFDTPSVLTGYGERNGADFAVWSLLTGAEDEIRCLADQVGVQFFKQGGMINHTGICVLVDGEGRLHKIHHGNDWTAAEIIDELAFLIRSNKTNKHEES